MKKLTHLYIVAFLALTLGLMLSCAKKDDGSSSSDNSSSTTTTTTDTTAPVFTVSEITQTVGSDGLYSGSFVIPDNGISFLLSIFMYNNNPIEFKSLTDPD